MTNSKISAEERRFMWAVQALALPADAQEQLFPDFAEAADELALEHEETQEPFLDGSCGTALSSAQREVITALDAQLEKMSGPDNARFWTSEALRSAVEWERVRVLAGQVLSKMNWRADAPPRDRGAIYVGPPDAG